MRKYFLFIATTIILISPLSAFAQNAGDLIKCPDFSSVYYLSEDDKRYVFPNEKIYFSWYDDFDDVVTITCNELGDYMIGGNITYKPGTRLVKIPSIPTVYAVEEGGALRAIQDEEQAIAIFGANWASLVDDLPESFFPAYEVGETLEDGEEPQGARKSLKTIEIDMDVLSYSGKYDGYLYDTVSQISEAPIAEYARNLKRNNVRYVIGNFSAEEDEAMDYLFMYQALEEAPGVFVPFIGTGSPVDEVELGESYTQMYEDVIEGVDRYIGEGILRGVGEIEQYGWGVSVDHPDVKALFDLASVRDIAVMFHPPDGDMEAVEEVLQDYPSTTFLIHMFPEEFDYDRDEIMELMENYDNLYYSVNVDHMLYDERAGTGLVYKYENEDVDDAVEEFAQDFDDQFDDLLDEAIDRYSPLMNAHPNRVMWGSEAYPEYAYKEEVYDRMIKFTRYFLTEFDEDVARQVGYENAVRVFGRGE